MGLQMAMRSSYNVLSSSKDVPEKMRFPDGMLQGHNTKKTVRERIKAWRSFDPW